MPGSPPRVHSACPQRFHSLPGLADFPCALPPRCARIHPVSSPSDSPSEADDATAAERSQPKVERPCPVSRGLARCLPGELHPPRRRLCKDGATSATRDRSRDRAEMVPLKRRGCRARSLEAYCRRGLVVSRRTMDVRFHLASVPLPTRPGPEVTSAGPTGHSTCEFHHRSLRSVDHSYRVDSRRPSA